MRLPLVLLLAFLAPTVCDAFDMGDVSTPFANHVVQII